MKRDTLESVCFLGSFPLGQAFSFWLVAIHHYFKSPSWMDAYYDFEADAAFLGFIFWILFAFVFFCLIELVYRREAK